MRSVIKSKKLNKAVDDFVKVMKHRLAEKEKEGFTGWDDINLLHLVTRAKTKLDDMDGPLESQSKQAVDIANFMMMIWWRNEGS